MTEARARFTRRDAVTGVACVIAVLWAIVGRNFVHADCWYNDETHEEGNQVLTPEPCLNCTCNRNALLCYLRVCPKLPNPPPTGCILLHRYRTCCPELICTDFLSGSNSIEARSDTDDDLLDTSLEDYPYKDACFLNGSVYGPGSAMHSSSFCEYCYCLGGKQVCVKPKCLVPLEGCIPVYDPTSCCPVKYDCGTPSTVSTISTTTTTTEMEQTTLKDSCIVAGHHYPEGSKVIGIGHSVCDNCYCLRGLLRCEPLSCAPPLLGCAPVVKPGECCAASYNCNGTIEIDPKPNYGYHPTVSKEYAKLRKEVQRKPGHFDREDVVTVAPLYVLPDSLPNPTSNKMQQRHPNTFGTTRHFSGTSKISSTETPSTSRKTLSKDNGIPGMYHATTNYEFQNTNYKRVYSTTLRTKENDFIKKKVSSNTLNQDHKQNVNDFFTFDDINILSLVDSLLDGRLYRQADNDTDSSSTERDNNKDKKSSSNLEHTTPVQTTTDYFPTLPTKIPNDLETTFFANEVLSTTPEITTESNEIYPVTVKTVLNSTDCTNNVEEALDNNKFDYTTILPIDPGEVNKLAESSTNAFSTTTENESASTTLISTIDRGPSKVKTRNKLPYDIFTILNQTSPKKSEDYDYDYNEPTLPPSLPNLKIIPFLAADAVDTKNEMPKESPVYVAEKSDSNFAYSSTYFSIPDASKEGFVPKDPILDNFYENVVSLTSRPQNVNCMSNGREILNGLSVTSDLPCTTCTCFYGSIVCQKPNCPPPNPGCRVASEEGITLCCPNYICDDPTVLLLPPIDRIDIPQEIVTVADDVLHPDLINSDPFKDVIKTEPAPNLESLIGDMIFQGLSINTTPSLIAAADSFNDTSTKRYDLPSITTAATESEGSFGLDAVLQFILGTNKGTTDKNELNITKDINSTTKNYTMEGNFLLDDNTNNTENNNNITKPVNTNVNLRNSTGSIPGVGLLKLAGCNIYGRMYRVGRIISELSGPCLECKCTEVGVQCKTLKCETS